MKNDSKQVLVLVDNIKIMVNGCYTRRELDFIEIVNEFIALSDKDPKTSIALGLNRDLFDGENSMDIQYYRDIKNSVFD